MAHNEGESPSITAAQRALALPEILHEILAHIRGDEDVFTASEVEPVIPGGIRSRILDDDDREDGVELYIEWQGALARCAEVNSLWFKEVIPLLWYDTSRIYTDTLDSVIRRIAPERRQLYATHVEQGTTSLPENKWERSEPDESDTLLRDIDFPNLRHLTIRIPIHADGPQLLPVFRAPKLQTLILDPQAEVYPTEFALEPTGWDTVFGQIARDFPRLKEVRVVDRTIIMPGAVERYREMLPGTKVEFFGATPWTEAFETWEDGVRRRLWHPDAGWLGWTPRNEIRDEWSQ